MGCSTARTAWSHATTNARAVMKSTSWSSKILTKKHRIKLSKTNMTQQSGNEMNIYQCQKYAEKNGFDSVEFTAHFPVGPTHCKWLDAYFGLFKIVGRDDGFLSTNEIDDIFPDLKCEVIQ